MRPLAVLALAGLLTTFALAAGASPARAAVPAIFDPPPGWLIGLSTKLVVRVLEFVDWALEDLREQADRRRQQDPVPPVVTPGLDAVAAGSSTTAPPPRRSARAGMIP